MAGFSNKILKTLIIAGIAPMLLIGAQTPNPRGISSAKNMRAQETESNAAQRRSATSVIARNVATNNRQKRAVVTARPANVQNVQARSVRSAMNNSQKSRTAINPSVARSGTNVKNTSKGASRANTARATAVFNDITKIGGGYADCRDSYATCMDQLCANANDTYRRCFCSDRFENFRDTADKLDSALTLLAEFQDNNLNAVDKTAAEVNAMYTASAGEKAIKRDTSASQKLLDSISDVLSGKVSKKQPKKTSVSLGVLDFSGFDSSEDVFGNNVSLFGGDSSTDLSTLEGKELYDNAAKQCAEISRASCGNEAMFNLAKSAYSIMITQDCNAYEKNISAKKASVEETVRTAEKYFRELRLDDYRAHHSADVNECLGKVESAMRQSTACGSDYEKCMDYTGLYINSVTGEPIYSQALFGLNSLIVLNGSADVLNANPEFNKVLDSKKMFATTALDSCRDLSDTVWYEFKRSAIIQIAQAQDEKIQQVKDSCVMTIKECYDSQTGALNEMDVTESQSTDAIAAVAARGMCYDRVMACAALYGDPDGCSYDDKTKKMSSVSGKKCGLQSLLAFVDTVDSVKVAEGCEAALTKYAQEICPDRKIIEANGEERVIPYGECALPEGNNFNRRDQVRAAMELRRKTFCASDLVNADNSGTDAFNVNIMNQIIKDMYDQMKIAFIAGCEDDKYKIDGSDSVVSGTWVYPNEVSDLNVSDLLQGFYKKYYGITINSVDDIRSLGEDMGYCVDKSGELQCRELGTNYASWIGGECVMTPNWYQDMCEDVLGGTWTNNQCVLSTNPNGMATGDIAYTATVTSGRNIDLIQDTSSRQEFLSPNQTSARIN